MGPQKSGNGFRPLRRFGADASAAIALIGCLVIPILIIATGAAVDITHVEMVHSALNDAADSATLAQISPSAIAMTPNGYNNSSGLQAIGLKYFNTNSASATGATITNSNSSVVLNSNNTITSTVSYTASVPTYLAGFFGVQKVNVSGVSTSQNSIAPYIDFYLLLDNSMSMGVGATLNDMANLQAATPDQCAFACHDLSNANSYYNVAKKIGMTMRIDVLRQATQSLMTTAEQDEKVTSQYRMAIYAFGATGVPTETVEPLQLLTSNLPGAATSAAALDVMTMYGQNLSNTLQTQYDTLLPQMNALIPNGGDGSVGNPNKVLFFVSDGVTDELTPSNCVGTSMSGVCQGPLNPALCTPIKARGISIAVLYTTYLPIPNNSQYTGWIQPFNAGPWGPSPNSVVAKNMQACASPGLYFEVSPSQGISQAMAQLFQAAVNVEHVTS